MLTNISGRLHTKKKYKEKLIKHFIDYKNIITKLCFIQSAQTNKQTNKQTNAEQQQQQQQQQRNHRLTAKLVEPCH